MPLAKLFAWSEQLALVLFAFRDELALLDYGL
jgi:hypothetical protein